MDDVMQWIAAKAMVELDTDGDMLLLAQVMEHESGGASVLLTVQSIDGEPEYLFEVPWKSVKALLAMLEAAQAQRDRASVSET
ncbi:MAG: hypothetical protein GX601_13540 [Anaerolineales bacterium]|nr:hypothetical protein [Anaerolineales bacterium]